MLGPLLRSTSHRKKWISKYSATVAASYVKVPLEFAALGVHQEGHPALENLPNQTFPTVATTRE